MKLSIPALTSLTSSAMHAGQAIEKRKKSGLSKGGGSNAPPDPVPDVGKDSPPSLPKGGATPAGAAPSNVGKDIPQSTPTDATAVVSDINKDSPISIPKPDSMPTGATAAAVSDVGKDIPTSTSKPGPTPAPVTAAPSTVTTTVISSTTVFSSTSTTTVHHTETTTVTGTGTGAVSVSASAPSGPVRAGESLSGAAMTDAILAQCPKTTDTVTRTVNVTPAPVTNLVTQTAFSSASPVTITVTSTVSPQADRAPTCSALPTHRKHVGPAEIMAIAFGLITLALLVAMFFLARKCYKMHRAQRVWGKQVRNEETELTEIAAGSGSGEEDVGAKPMAVHPARTKLGQRLMDKLAKSFERKESWEK